MSENYFYSSLSGQEIENTLLGAVRYNTDQQLTTSQKALARQNIGAGEADTQIKIKGFYDTLTDLQQAIPVGNEGDVYAVGTESPYDIYIWDAVNNVWVNNGPISFSDAIIDDNDVSTTSVWSSSKTTNEIGALIADSAIAANKVWSSSKLSSMIVRPNLLDNWFFATSRFPVNQRGQSSYSGNSEYCVDRWYRRNDAGAVTGTVTLSNDGLQILFAKEKDNALNQPIEYEQLLGKTVTLSALFDGVSPGSLLSLHLVASNSHGLNTSPIGAVNVNGNGLFSVTINVPSTIGDYSMVNFGLHCNIHREFSGTLIAAKLEIGTGQTLAHQENGVWVLNEIPDYKEELLKCQSYLVKFQAYQRKRADAVLGNAIDFLFPIPCTMASLPSIIGTPAVHLFGQPETEQTGFTFSAPGQGGGYIQIRATKNNHGLTEATCYGTSTWFLSCEP